MTQRLFLNLAQTSSEASGDWREVILIDESATLACHLTNSKRPAFMKKSAKDAPSSVLSESRGQLDRRKPFCRFRSPSFWSSRRAAAGFWYGCQSAQCRQKLRKGPAHARWRQLLHWKRRLPGQAVIADERPREAELDIGQDH